MLVDSQSKIMFEELPNVDKLWQLLNDILLVRSLLLLELENVLYEKLILIHRDPHLLMWLTRDPKEMTNARLQLQISTEKRQLSASKLTLDEIKDIEEEDSDSQH
jgi:hypothetical protein